MLKASSVELLSPIAPPDAQAAASCGFRLFVSLATVPSGSDRLGTIDLPIRVLSYCPEVDPIIRTTGGPALDSGHRSFSTQWAIDFPGCLITQTLMRPVVIVVIKEAF